MGRSIYCSTCRKEKEPGRDNESRCKSCKSEANKKRRAKKREELGLEPFNSGRSKNCYDCKRVKENKDKGYCNECNRKRDREWRISTGRTRKAQTGLCPCGKKRASYSPSYCVECIAKRDKEWRKNHPYTPEQLAHRSKLQRKRNAKKRGHKKLKLDSVNILRRKKYHDNSYQALIVRIKHQVRSLTRGYIRAGKLIKGPCEVCKVTVNVEAHHDDYEKPMDIRWLCRKHHREHHKMEERPS